MILLVLVVLTLLLTPLSSVLPDGLEYTAEKLSFHESATESAAPSLEPVLGSWWAGVAGAALTALVAFGLYRLRSHQPVENTSDGKIRNP